MHKDNTGSNVQLVQGYYPHPIKKKPFSAIAKILKIRIKSIEKIKKKRVTSMTTTNHHAAQVLAIDRQSE